MQKKIGIALAMLALISSVSLPAVASGLAVEGASGYPYGRSYSATYTFGTSGQVSFSQRGTDYPAWAIPIPISNLTSSYWVGASAGGNSLAEMSAWVFSSSGAPLASYGLQNGVETRVTTSQANSTLMVRMTVAYGPYAGPLVVQSAWAR